MKEKILCAAIWYMDFPSAKIQPINIQNGVVLCGHRHAHIIHQLVALTGKRAVETEVGKYTQGFLTNTNRFVDRKEGWKIALEAGQIINLEKFISDKEDQPLFSEDLY